jgi:hypothetical protein
MRREMFCFVWSYSALQPVRAELRGAEVDVDVRGPI